MRKLPRPPTENPTTSQSKTVASEKRRGRALRGLLAGMLRSIRRERPLPNIEGDLSSWIFQLHGLTRHGTTQEPGGDAAEVQVPPSLVNWIQQVASPELDLRKIETAVTKARQT